MDLLDQMKAFIEQVYFVDVCAIGAMYAEWLKYGSGVTNYLAVPDLPTDTKGTQFDLPGGTIFNGALSKVTAITSFEDPYFQKNVSECIMHAWYDGDWTRHPYEEDTVPHHTPYEADKKYSWIKAPRFDGHPMQVGPLAQVLVGQGHDATTRWAAKALATAGKVAGSTLTPAVLHSFDPCIAARFTRSTSTENELSAVNVL
jgi:hydrogenase large subunit